MVAAGVAGPAARPPSRAQQPIVPAHGARPPGERAERQSLTSDSGRGGSMENCMAHSTVHNMNAFTEYPGTFTVLYTIQYKTILLYCFVLFTY